MPQMTMAPEAATRRTFSRSCGSRVSVANRNTRTPLRKAAATGIRVLVCQFNRTCLRCFAAEIRKSGMSTEADVEAMLFNSSCSILLDPDHLEFGLAGGTRPFESRRPQEVCL